MKRPFPLAFAIALCLSTVLAFSMDSAAHDPKKPEPAHSMAGHSTGSMELHRVMMQGQKMPMPMSGNVDKDFATMMTLHHQQAVKMADVLLRHGRSAELKALAGKMKAAQQAEIKLMACHTK